MERISRQSYLETKEEFQLLFEDFKKSNKMQRIFSISLFIELYNDATSNSNFKK